eukprot:SAG31_NODE_4306_length_3369_cov_3.736159_1_plen_141_part_00
MEPRDVDEHTFVFDDFDDSGEDVAVYPTRGTRWADGTQRDGNTIIDWGQRANRMNRHTIACQMPAQVSTHDACNCEWDRARLLTLTGEGLRLPAWCENALQPSDSVQLRLLLTYGNCRCQVYPFCHGFGLVHWLCNNCSV